MPREGLRVGRRARRTVRPWTIALVAVLALVVGTGAWWIGRSTAGSGPSAAATPIGSTAPVASTAPTTTSTTIPRQVAGTRLPAGPATVYVLGDSVILGARSQVPAALAGWEVTFDAKESRRIDQGTEILAARTAPVARVLVVHLCSNWSGADYRAEAVRLLDAAKGVDRVVWLTCTPWRSEVEAADRAIRALPDEFPHVVVADWHVLAGEPGYTAGDRLHLNAPGAKAIASLVAGSVGPVPNPS